MVCQFVGAPVVVIKLFGSSPIPGERFARKNIRDAFLRIIVLFGFAVRFELFRCRHYVQKGTDRLSTTVRYIPTWSCVPDKVLLLHSWYHSCARTKVGYFGY